MWHISEVILGPNYATQSGEESQGPEEWETQGAQHEQSEASEEGDLGEQQEARWGTRGHCTGSNGNTNLK